MCDAHDKSKQRLEQAEAAVECAQKHYDEAEPGPTQESRLQLLLAENKALDQARGKESLHLKTPAGVGQPLLML